MGSTLKMDSCFIAVQNDFFGDRHHITTVGSYRQNEDLSLDEIVRQEYSHDK